MINDKVNPSGQITQQQKAHSIFVIFWCLFWQANIEISRRNPTQNMFHQLIPEFIRVFRIYVMLKFLHSSFCIEFHSVDICQERSQLLLLRFFYWLSKLEFGRLSFSTCSRTWKQIFNIEKREWKMSGIKEFNLKKPDSPVQNQLLFLFLSLDSAKTHRVAYTL